MRVAPGATPLGRFVHAARDPKIRVMIERLMLVLRFIGTSFLSLIRRGSCQEYDGFRLHPWLNRQEAGKLIDKRVIPSGLVSAGSFQGRRLRVIRDQTDDRLTKGRGHLMPTCRFHGRASPAWLLHDSPPVDLSGVIQVHAPCRVHSKSTSSSFMRIKVVLSRPSRTAVA